MTMSNRIEDGCPLGTSRVLRTVHRPRAIMLSSLVRARRVSDHVHGRVAETASKQTAANKATTVNRR